MSASSCDSVSHGELSALFTARISALSLSRGLTSKSVRAGVVTRIPSCVLTSRRWSVVDRCTAIPVARRSPGTVISNGRSHRFQKPHRVIAEPWLSAAPAPQARTAAAARWCGVTGGWPTA